MNSITGIGLCFYGGFQFTSTFAFVGQAMQECGLRCQFSLVKGAQLEGSRAGVVLTFKCRAVFCCPIAPKPSQSKHSLTE